MSLVADAEEAQTNQRQRWQPAIEKDRIIFMVAGTSNLAARFFPPPDPLMAGRWRLVRLTRQDAQAMMRMGIIPEDASTELLDRCVVLKDCSARDQDPTTTGQEHRKCVERLSSLRKMIDNDNRHVESQQPLVCSDTQVPEPDFEVLRGTLDRYTDLPLAPDACCVVEVADSSYERDTGEKLAGYAEAAIAQYIVINLHNRTAEVYANPDSAAKIYPPATIVDAGGSLELRIGEGEFFSAPLADLLP